MSKVYFKSQETKEAFREKLRKSWIERRKTPVSEITKSKMSFIRTGKKQSLETRKKNSLSKSGINNPNWKGGISQENKRIRASAEYRLWREAVFERDDYTCVWCGSRCGNGKNVTLHADHIKPFAYYPELRFAIDNGRTLCIECHKTTETYGNRK